MQFIIQYKFITFHVANTDEFILLLLWCAVWQEALAPGLKDNRNKLSGYIRKKRNCFTGTKAQKNPINNLQFHTRRKDELGD